MTHGRPSVRFGLLLGIAGGSVSAVALYGVLRIVQAHLFPEANPATIIWSAHAGYFWRAWTVAYAGAMGGFAAFAAARRSPVRAARALRGAVVVASLIILYQGLFVP
jgi:hypothetical protein